MSCCRGVPCIGATLASRVSPARPLLTLLLPAVREAGLLVHILAQVLQEPKSCLFSCAWEFVTPLFPKIRDPSCHCRALAGKHSGVSVCYGWCVFTPNRLPSCSKSSSAAEIVAFPARSSCVAGKSKELSCLRNTHTDIYIYTYICICVWMKSMSAVPASVPLSRGPARDGTGWGAELGLLLVPALQQCLFSPLPEDAPFYTARQPCL